MSLNILLVCTENGTVITTLNPMQYTTVLAQCLQMNNKPSTHDVLLKQFADNLNNIRHIDFVNQTVDALLQHLPRNALKLCARLIRNHSLHRAKSRRGNVCATRFSRQRFVGILRRVLSASSPSNRRLPWLLCLQAATANHDVSFCFRCCKLFSMKDKELSPEQKKVHTIGLQQVFLSPTLKNYFIERQTTLYVIARAQKI